MLKITSNTVTGYARILRRVHAAGLSRVLEHMWKGPFGIVSAARAEEDDKDRTSQLKNLLKQKGQGFIDLQGGYLYEKDGKPKVPVQEASVFLPNISEAEIRELAVQFEQESYIFGEGGNWFLKETKSGAVWAEGMVEDTFEALRQKEVGEDFPYMSQIRGKEGLQFRLDPDLVNRRRQEQEELMRDQRRVAFRLVKNEPCFYSIAGNFRPRPPVCLPDSGIKQSEECPDGALLDCWLPLQIDAVRFLFS